MKLTARTCLCTTAACTDEQTIISGFTAAAQPDILSRPDFVRKDGSNQVRMDQVYLFLFSGDPINAYTAVAEIGNPGGTKLEVDFIGTGTVVPLPGAAWVFGTGLIALAGVARRKRAAAE